MRLGQRGESSLSGLLVAMSLSVVVMLTSFTVFDLFNSHASALEHRATAQDFARRASDGVARALRNLASPVPEQPEAVDYAGPNDLVFKTVDRVGPNSGQNVTNVRRVRYCLATSTGELWQQVQVWTTATAPAMPALSGCPGNGWASSERLVAGLTNVADGRSVFTYNATTLTDISRISVELRIVDKAKTAPAAVVQTGVFLRNQNRRPVAAFSAVRSAQGIALNGSASYDPEGDPLTYNWYDGGTLVGNGIAYTHKVTPGTSHTMTLTVSDPAGLQGSAPAQVVVG